MHLSVRAVMNWRDEEPSETDSNVISGLIRI